MFKKCNKIFGKCRQEFQNKENYDNWCEAFYDKSIVPTFFKFPMKFLRLVFQIEEFYICIVLTNILIEYNLIFICTQEGFLNKIFSLFHCTIFTYISSGILAIYYYEFSQLTWIRSSNILYSLRLTENKKEISEVNWNIKFVLVGYFYVTILLLFIHLMISKCFYFVMTLFVILFYVCPIIKVFINYLRFWGFWSGK